MFFTLFINSYNFYQKYFFYEFWDFLPLFERDSSEGRPGLTWYFIFPFSQICHISHQAFIDTWRWTIFTADNLLNLKPSAGTLCTAANSWKPGRTRDFKLKSRLSFPWGHSCVSPKAPPWGPGNTLDPSAAPLAVLGFGDPAPAFSC